MACFQFSDQVQPQPSAVPSWGATSPSSNNSHDTSDLTSPVPTAQGPAATTAAYNCFGFPSPPTKPRRNHGYFNFSSQRSPPQPTLKGGHFNFNSPSSSNATKGYFNFARQPPPPRPSPNVFGAPLSSAKGFNFNFTRQSPAPPPRPSSTAPTPSKFSAVHFKFDISPTRPTKKNPSTPLQFRTPHQVAKDIAGAFLAKVFVPLCRQRLRRKNERRQAATVIVRGLHNSWHMSGLRRNHQRFQQLRSQWRVLRECLDTPIFAVGTRVYVHSKKKYGIVKDNPHHQHGTNKWCSVVLHHKQVSERFYTYDLTPMSADARTTTPQEAEETFSVRPHLHAFGAPDLMPMPDFRCSSDSKMSRLSNSDLVRLDSTLDRGRRALKRRLPIAVACMQELMGVWVCGTVCRVPRDALLLTAFERAVRDFVADAAPGENNAPTRWMDAATALMSSTEGFMLAVCEDRIEYWQSCWTDDNVVECPCCSEWVCCHETGRGRRLASAAA